MQLSWRQYFLVGLHDLLQWMVGLQQQQQYRLLLLKAEFAVYHHHNRFTALSPGPPG